MRILKIKVVCETGFAGCKHTDELFLEVEDDATPEEIDQAASELTNEWAMNRLDIGFTIEED